MKRWLVVLERADRRLERVERCVLVGAVLAMAALNIANVGSRNLLGQSLAFAEELNQALLVWITFLGISAGVREGRHIRMSALYDQLSGRARKVALAGLSLATGVLLLALAALAARYVASVAAAGSVTPALRLPLAWIYAWVPLGLALGGLQYLGAALRNACTPGPWLALRREERFEPPDAGTGV